MCLHSKTLKAKKAGMPTSDTNGGGSKKGWCQFLISFVLIRVALRHWKVTSGRRGCIFYLECCVPTSSFLRTVRELELEIFISLGHSVWRGGKQSSGWGGLEAWVGVLALYLTCCLWPSASVLTSLGLRVLCCRMDQITGSQQQQKNPPGEGSGCLLDDWAGAKDDSHPTMHSRVLNTETAPQVPQISRQNFL